MTASNSAGGIARPSFVGLALTGKGVLISIRIVRVCDDLVLPAFGVARCFSPRSVAQPRGLKHRATQGIRPAIGCGSAAL